MPASDPVAGVHQMGFKARMRILFAIVLALPGCSSQTAREVPANEVTSVAPTSPSARSVAIMNEIEQQVQLPAEAAELGHYARYYAFDGRRVVAAYVSYVNPRRPDFDLPLGDRRWVTDRRNLPVIMDGGCLVVNVIYDPASKKIESAFCNGLT